MTSPDDQSILDLVGQVGRYRILDLVGAGGMGVVYSAYDPELDRRVALKLVRTAAGEEPQRARLLREARAIARVAHPNVVAVHDAGTVGDRVFIAMEFVDGATLTRWAPERSLPERLEALAQAGQGLLAAHRAGLVHRDFKPDNVLVGRDGRVRVTDFGLPRPQGAYTAPEEQRGEPTDARSDVFSFCVTVWECLHGSPPSAARAEAIHVPAPLRRLLARGLDASPEERPSLEELLGALEPAARNRAWLLLAAAALIALALAGLRLQQLARNRALCQGGEARLSGVWDEARKQSLRKVHAARDATMLGGLEAALDHYAGAWVADHREACEATHVRGEQSTESLELRMECLDQRRRELDAFVTWTVEDAERLADAAVAAHRLAPVSECDNVSALRNIIRPSVPAAELEAMRARLAHLQAFRFVSSVRTQGDEARSLAEAARRAGALHIAAGAVEIEAAVARANADLKGAAGYYREAAMLAGMAHDDTSLAHILVASSRLAAGIRADFTRGFELLDYATAVTERLGGDPHARWDLLRVRGNVEWRADRLKDAEQHYREALVWLDRSKDKDAIDRASILNDLADCVGDQGRFDESLAMYREALALFHDTLGDEHVQTLTLRNNVAVDLYESGKVAEAAELQRAVLAGYEKRADPLGLANALWTLGLFVEPKNLDEAEALYRRSLALYEKSVGRDLVDLCYPLTGLGRVALARGHAAEALPYLERALALQDAPELRDAPDRAETELALAQALASGPRALALATHARDVLKARPSGPTRAALVRRAEELVARLR